MTATNTVSCKGSEGEERVTTLGGPAPLVIWTFAGSLGSCQGDAAGSTAFKQGKNTGFTDNIRGTGPNNSILENLFIRSFLPTVVGFDSPVNFCWSLSSLRAQPLLSQSLRHQGLGHRVWGPDQILPITYLCK